MTLDRTDQSILVELQREGRLSNHDLADRYTASINRSKVGLPGNVFVSITRNIACCG